MNLFQLARNCLNWTNPGTDRTPDTSFGIDLGFLAQTTEQILDSFGRARCGADSAIDAFLVINPSQIVGYSDSLNWAFAAADPTTDARQSTTADFAGFRAFVLGTAFDVHITIDRHQCYQAPGTSFHASPTSSTFLIINTAHAVLIYRDGVKHTSFLAIIITNTAPGTGIGSPGYVHC